MLTVRELGEQLKANYPKSTSQKTNSKRNHNIKCFKGLIDTAKSAAPLAYSENEERVFLYKTLDEESIIIQFPGKESVAANPLKVRPYDFRPKIIKKDGTVLRDLVFADLWYVVEELSESHKEMLKCLSTLFFRMGRMLSHEQKIESCDYNIIDEDLATTATGTITLDWYKLVLDNEVLESFRIFIPSIEIDKEVTISFEAFLYFFDLILQNEDIKYNYIKHDLSSGRIPTSDSMLLLTSYFLKESTHTTLSTLIQRYVSGRGVGKCLREEITPATGNLVQFVDRKSDLMERFDSEGIKYINHGRFTKKGNNIKISLKTKSPKVAITDEYNPVVYNTLTNDGYTVYDFESALDDSYYTGILQTFGLS